MQQLSQEIAAVFLLLLLCYSHCCLLEFEAENGATSGRTMQRTQASKGLSVYLARVGQHVTHTFSTDTVCTVQVNTVRYANDGPSDVIQVLLDETTMGRFSTREKSNYGRAWNEFLNTSSIGNTIEIHPGSHEMTLSVHSTDRYGVELDKTTLQITCEGSDTGENDDCLTEDDTATQDTTTTEGGTTATPAGSDATPEPLNYCFMEFEAENGVTSGQTMHRSGASGELSVSLTSEGQVTHPFSTDTICSIQVHSITYSNDGQSDRIQISLDRTMMGTFRTRAKSNNGHAWNEFLNANSIGDTIEIRPGSHELTLSVTFTDRYGVELDRTTLQLTCAGSGNQKCPTTEETASLDPATTESGATATPEEQSKGSEYNSNLLRVGEITGIALASVALVTVLVFVTIAVLICARKKECKTYEHL